MVQSSTVIGELNIVVQIEGNGNTVVTGKPHLNLTRFEAAQRLRFDDARILLPTARRIPLVGRDAEMAALLDFVRSDAPNDIRARVLVGDGGSGKTRLALEFCDHIKNTWNAGFVTNMALERFFKQQDAGEWGWQKPTLIVLDYAAAQANVLAPWLRELQDRTAPPYPLRILLLERHADPAHGWHQAVFNSGSWQNQGTSDLLDPPEPVRIRPLSELSDRMAIVRSVLELTAPKLIEQLDQSPSLANQINEAQWGGDPLYLAMAALTMARSGDVSAFQLGRADLASYVASHEQSRLREMALSRHLDPVLVHHLSACITLVQGLPRDAAIDLVRAEKLATGFDNADAPAHLVDLLHQALGDGADIAPVRPDLIGEALLLRAWSHPERASAIQRLYVTRPQPVLETLVRLVQDFGFDNPTPSAWFKRLMKAFWGDLAELDRIYAAVPRVTVALRGINLQLAQRLRELDVASAPETRAMRLGHLASALSEIGQREQALEEAKQALGLWRKMSFRRPIAFFASLARSLDELAGYQRALGNLVAALEAEQESIDYQRILAWMYPAEFTSGLAVSLINRAGLLHELGKREQALKAAQQAVNLCRKLAIRRHDVFNSYLAASLGVLAGVLKGLGQREKALEAAQQSVDIQRYLARKRPDAFRPYLAVPLSNLATILSEMGQREKALEAAQQAVSIHRDLARQHPKAFNENLAGSLRNLATILSELGQREDALEAIQEAVDIQRDLTRQNPEEFKANLARSLHNLGGALIALGQRERALEATQQAVDLRRELALRYPDAFMHEVAESLNNLSLILSQLGQREKAQEAAQ